MQDRVQSFLHYMSAERGASRNTIDAYRNDLRGFVGFAGEQDGSDAELTPSCIDRELVTGYIGWLGERSYAASTIARKVAALKSFCGFLLDHGDLAANPTATIDSPRAPKPVPKPLTTQEVDSLLRQPAMQETPEAIRDAAMLELMYATGMRVTELVSVNVESMHLEPRPGYVRCIGKGEKERTIPVHERALDAVERYLDEARPLLLKNRPAARAVRQPPRRAADAAGLLADPQGLRAQGQHRDARHAAHAAPLLRHAHACAGAPPCATCRNCSATPTSPPRRSTPSSRTATCARSTSRSTPAPAERRA